MNHWLDTLKARELVQDFSDEEALRTLKSKTPFYVGIDPTAQSLQLGNLVPLIVSIHLAKADLEPLILFGGATGSIGDPSGKSQERSLLSLDEVRSNAAAQKEQVSDLFARQGVSCSFVNNLDWTEQVSLLEFLRDVGKHFTVNYMLAKDSVKSRLESSGISYTEFSYMLLQAYDFFHLYQTQNCRLQIGGSDQWGNMTAGLELIRRKIQGEAAALCFPLVTDSQGRKFGKSAEGAVWLNAEQTSPYSLHQFLLNTADEDVVRYLKMFTFLELKEIEDIENLHLEKPESRTAQKALADALCTIVHGEDATREATKGGEILFGGDLTGATDAELIEVFSEVPSSEIPRERVSSLSALELMVEAGIVSSKGEGKRLITGGGAYLNNQRIDSPQTQTAELLSDGRSVLILRSGKKKYHLVRLT